MGILATDKKQIILIYSEDSSLGKKTRARVENVDLAKRIININDESISKTIWLEIAELLNTELCDLFDVDDERIHDKEFHTKDWLKLIDKNPALLVNPIIIKGARAKIIDDNVDVYEFIEATGSNFDKSPEAIKEGEH